MRELSHEKRKLSKRWVIHRLLISDCDCSSGYKSTQNETPDACDTERQEGVGEKFRGTFGTGADN